MTPIAVHQLDILQRTKVCGTKKAAVIDDLKEQNFDLILDELIGYRLKYAPFGLIGDLIKYANGSGIPILSLDTPSGVKATTRTVYDPRFPAAATLTLALPKDGLFDEAIAKLTGGFYLADIGVPPGLSRASALAMTVGPLFAHDNIIKAVPE